MMKSKHFSLSQYVRQNPLLSQLELHYHWGNLDKPVVIMVHGHAVCKKSWMDPMSMTFGYSRKNALGLIQYVTQEMEEEDLKKMLPPGSFVFATVKRPEPRNEVKSFWELLGKEGYSLVTWNQRYPNGKIHYAIEELELVYKFVESHPLTKEIIILSHSRGGLVARSFLQNNPEALRRIKALIMLGTPNHGSMLATFAEKFARFKNFPSFVLLAKRFLPPSLQKQEILEELLSYINRGIEFLQSEAVSELKWNSSFILGLKEKEELEENEHPSYYHMVGTNSQYDKIYYNADGEKDLLEIPLYYKKLPSFLLPWELVDGKGDGLVATYRAKLGFEKIYEEYPANHSELLTDKKIQNRVIEILRK